MEKNDMEMSPEFTIQIFSLSQLATIIGVGPVGVWLDTATHEKHTS
jgi:hypothetical protein